MRVISLLIEDTIGVLSRIVEIFSSRGYNLDSICSGTCEEEGLHRMTLVCDVDPVTIKKVVKLLNQLIHVIDVKVIDAESSISRELLLIKVETNSQNRNEILNIINGIEGKIVDMNDNHVSVEVTGYAQKLNSFIALMRKFKIIEMARTGEASINYNQLT